MRHPRLLTLPVALALLVGLAACGDNTTDTSASSTTVANATTTVPLTGDLTVSAASSLTGAFTEIGHQFEAEHSGTKITFNFDSSTTLADQIVAGAPADAFASADQKNMDRLTSAGLVDGSANPFATNTMTIVTKPGNPHHVASLKDLTNIGVVALCADSAPCGKYAAQILTAAGVTIPETSVTRGQNAKATLTAVSEGDAEAAIVFVTDAKSAPSGVDAVPIPAAENTTAIYPIGLLKSSTNGALGKAFVTYVLGSAGQSQLRKAGFGAP